MTADALHAYLTALPQRLHGLAGMPTVVADEPVDDDTTTLRIVHVTPLTPTDAVTLYDELIAYGLVPSWVCRDGGTLRGHCAEVGLDAPVTVAALATQAAAFLLAGERSRTLPMHAPDTLGPALHAALTVWNQTGTLGDHHTDADADEPVVQHTFATFITDHLHTHAGYSPHDRPPFFLAATHIATAVSTLVTHGYLHTARLLAAHPCAR